MHRKYLIDPELNVIQKYLSGDLGEFGVGVFSYLHNLYKPFISNLHSSDRVGLVGNTTLILLEEFG